MKILKVIKLILTTLLKADNYLFIWGTGCLIYACISNPDILTYHTYCIYAALGLTASIVISHIDKKFKELDK